jgi:DUF4097 and DUF4098 domain-containing protein YvlB
MNLARHNRTVARLAVACAALFTAAALVPRAHAEEWTKSYSLSGRPQVRVDSNDASVRIYTGDTKSVDFRVDYDGYELNKSLHIESSQNGDSVQINARTSGHWGFSWGSHRNLKIEVHMPQNADLQIDTGDGSVQTQAVNGRVKIHTGDGSVRVEGVNGDADITSGDGSITIESAKGNIRVHTGDGGIDGHNLDGNLEASSGDGHIRIDGRIDSLNLKTGDGSINARIAPGSKMASTWTVHTGDGSVDMVIPSDLQANIDASTNDGHISLGIPVTVEGTFSNSKIHGKMNGGGQSLTIHTGDGSIRLSKS